MRQRMTPFGQKEIRAESCVQLVLFMPKKTTIAYFILSIIKCKARKLEIKSHIVF